MSKKLIYFVRHGETELNAKGIKQGVEGALSARGRAQAADTAQKFPRHQGSPQIIISSPYPRTRETSEIIANQLKLNIEYTDLLAERRNPSEVIGRSTKDREVEAIVDRIEKSFHDDNFRYSDEENFVDLRDRAKKLLQLIKSRPESRIIMVTHRAFLKMILAYMFLDETLDAKIFNKVSYFNPIDNAGLTIVQYTPHWFKKDEWKLIAQNSNLIEEPPKTQFILE
ncbi:MAG: histidine phosphatase family protein [Patescibacteria group bacterium]